MKMNHQKYYSSINHRLQYTLVYTHTYIKNVITKQLHCQVLQFKLKVNGFYSDNTVFSTPHSTRRKLAKGKKEKGENTEKSASSLVNFFFF